MSSSTSNTIVEIPTQPTSDNSTNIATTAYVQNNLTNLLPITTANATYVSMNSPSLTGTPTAPTPSTTNVSDTIATTKYFNDKLPNYSIASYSQPIDLSNYCTANTANATYAPIDSPSLTGTPTVPTPPTTDNSTRIASTEYIQTNLANYITNDTASSTYATINNLSDYLSTNVANTTYAPLNSPTLSGTPTVPTQALSNNSTTIANTKFVSNLLDLLTNATAKLIYATTANLSNYLTTNTANASYAKINSPEFTGTPTTLTPTTSDNLSRIATTAYANSKLSTFVPSVISVTNNTTDTNDPIVLSPGSGTTQQIIKNNTALSFNPSTQNLLINNSYYLYGCNPTALKFTGVNNTYELTAPLYPYYTFVGTGFTGNLNIILPKPSADYAGFSLTMRKVGTGTGSTGKIFFTTSGNGNDIIRNGQTIKVPVASTDGTTANGYNVLPSTISKYTTFKITCLQTSIHVNSPLTQDYYTQPYYWYYSFPV